MVFTGDKKKHTKKRYILVLCVVAISILFLCCVNARLTLKGLESVQRSVIGDETKKVIINPQGPLNLLRGYIYEECGFMYNKRLFAPEIDIKYSLYPEPNRYKNPEDPCIFKRIFADDKARNKEEKYSYEYHTTLIHMFPTVENNSVSINSTRTNSFTTFLREQRAKEDVFRFLAALLLLSEGIEVPLKCISTVEGNTTENKIILKKKNSEGNFFSLDTEVIVYNCKRNNTDEVTETETVQVIEFFKSNVEKTREEPKTLEEFEKGQFLDTPQFLIQTYLFEFLETIEEVIELNEAVYDILCDMYPEEKMQIDNPAVEEKLSPVLKERKIERPLSSSLCKYFVCANFTEIEKAYTHSQKLEEIRLFMGQQDIFPFSYKNHIRDPIFTTIPEYYANDSKDNLSLFENTVETQLYIFFCCLLYNPETGKYSLDKIKKPSKRLKRFFTKYSRPFESTTNKMLEEWTNVVSGLPTGEIRYLQPGKQLKTGMFNFFLVVANITGCKKEEKQLVKFKKELEEVDRNDRFGAIKFYTDVCNYLEDVLGSLCVSEMTEIVCGSGYSIPDGSIYSIEDIKKKLKYFQIQFANSESMHSGKKPYITLELCKEFTIHSNITIDKDLRVRDIDAAELEKTRKELTAKEKKSFIDLLLIQYIKNMTITAKKEVEVFGKEGILIKDILENNLKGVNRIFLLRKIEDLKYKLFVIGCFLSRAQERKINADSESPLQHFTSNILGSVSLDNDFTRISFLRPLLYANYSLDIYPSLNLPGKLSTGYLKIRYLCDLEEISYILYTMSTDVLVRALKDHGLEDGINESIFSYINGIEKIFDCLFNNNSIDSLKSLFSSRINTYDLSHKMYIHGVFFICFVIACQRKKEHRSFILDLYDQIEPEIIRINYNMYNVSDFLDFHQKNRKDASEVVTAMQEELIKRKGGKEKFEKVLEFFNTKLEIKDTQIERPIDVVSESTSEPSLEFSALDSFSSE